MERQTSEAEGELQDTLEKIIGESIHESDYREAAMVVAQRNPELISRHSESGDIISILCIHSTPNGTDVYH